MMDRVYLCRLPPGATRREGLPLYTQFLIQNALAMQAAVNARLSAFS